MKHSKEVEEKLDKIYAFYMQKSREVLITAARESSIYETGDIIKSEFGEIGKVKQRKIGLGVHDRRYTLGYVCEKLTKKLEPYKDGRTILIRIEQVVEKLNKD